MPDDLLTGDRVRDGQVRRPNHRRAGQTTESQTTESQTTESQRPSHNDRVIVDQECADPERVRMDPKRVRTEGENEACSRRFEISTGGLRQVL